ncbi:MAG TPA: hypothetical protein DEB31_02915 [Clostridiales bacterium]|nr:hypothetical protein [Clostridiales bacterium]
MSKKKPVFDCDSDTQNKILDTATTLFALKGFKAVTLKEIAKKVGIKIASIYYYYEDKDALIEDILLRFGEVYEQANAWLHKKVKSAKTLDEMLDSLYDRDYSENISPILLFGMAMTIKEQHNHESARKYAFEYIYKGSINNVKESFDSLIESGEIPPSDTKTLATLFIFCVMAYNELSVFELAGIEPPIDNAKTFLGFKKLMKAALSQGILQEDEL